MIKIKSNTLSLGVGLAAILAFTACSGPDVKKKDTKNDVKEKKIVKVDKAVQETGLKKEAIEKFQAALAELKKPKSDNVKVAKMLEEVLSIEPEFAEAHYNYGMLKSKAGQPELAKKHIEKARDLDADVPQYAVALARVYAVVGEYDKAETIFKEVVARDPNNLTAKNNLAILSYKRGQLDDSMKYIKEILRENNEHVGALTTLGLVYKNKKNYGLSEFIFKEAAKIEKKAKRPNADLQNNLGLVYLAQNNVPKAVKAFEEANKQNSKYLQSRLNLGALLIGYLDYEAAGKVFNEAVAIAPAHCVARLGKAATDYALSKFKDSASGYKFYIDTCNTKHLSSYERLAKLYESKLKDYPEAIKYYEKLLELQPDEKKKTNYKAMIQFLKSESKKPKAPEKKEEPKKEEPKKEEAPKTDAKTDGAKTDGAKTETKKEEPKKEEVKKEEPKK